MKHAVILFAMLVSMNASAHAQEIIPSAATRFARPDSDAVPDFQKHVVPLLGRLGCNSAKCHGSFQGQGGLRLSLFGFDFRSDHRALVGEAYSTSGVRVDLVAPDESLIVLKATEQTDHGGGQRIAMASWEHHLLLRWIESGGLGAEFSAASTADATETSKVGLTLFETKIRPLLEDNCSECHGASNPKANLAITAREHLIDGGDSGAAIVPGAPGRSLLIQAIRYSDGDLQMPPAGKLKPQEIADLEEWVRMGAPWPDGYDATTGGDTSQVLAQLHFEPAEILFHALGDTSQIRVIAEWPGGEREDVTCLSRFQTNNDAVVRVDRDGLATSIGPGDTHIVAFYDNGVAAIPVLRPYASNAAWPNGIAHSDHPIDRLVGAKLNKLGLVPAGLCTDAEFLRRVSIDMTGSLPAPKEVIAFLDDTSADKRVRKIDELLERSTYAAWWSNKLCDFTGCNPASIRSLQEVAVEEGYVKASQWYDWIYEQVARNESYDKIVQGIMLADLSPRGTGMPHFWTRQSLQEPKDTAMSVAHAFLGIQLQCAECHKHPFDQWTQSDFHEFARFFEPVTRTKRRASVAEAQDIGLLRSHVVSLQVGDDARTPIMDWMRGTDNPWFARSFVNRVWAGYFHIGIVDPPDQFTPANPPSNPQLLDWLTTGFIESGYDMRWLHRQIASSQTYQRSWKPNDTNRNDRRNFSRAIPRRIPAEVIYDALKQSTAANDDMDEVRTNLKRRASGHLSMRMAGTHAMRVFGKPDRSINCDCERVNEPTLLQAIFTHNDPLVRMRLEDSGWIAELDQAVVNGIPLDREELIRQVWLRTVNRPPTDEERVRSLEHLGSVDSITEGIGDLMWAMINTKEYLLNH